MNEALVFPIDQNCFYQMKLGLQIVEYKVKQIASYRSWGVTGQLIKLSDLEYVVNDETAFINSGEEIDTWIIPELNLGVLLQEQLMELICQGFGRFQRIICCTKMEGQYWKEVQEKSQTYETVVISCWPPRPTVKKAPLYQIQTPIVAVAKTWEGMNETEIALLLKKELEADGYSVLHITNSAWGVLCGMCTFPWDLICKDGSGEKQVRRLNAWLYQLAKKERPDLIIIEMPTPLQVLSSDYTTDFGMTSYLIFQALIVDYLILSTFFSREPDELFHKISQMCEYRFGLPVDCFHLTNQRLELSIVKEVPGQALNRLTEDDFQKAIHSTDLMTTSLFLDGAGKKMKDDIIRKLS